MIQPAEERPDIKRTEAQTQGVCSVFKRCCTSDRELHLDVQSRRHRKNPSPTSKARSINHSVGLLGHRNVALMAQRMLFTIGHSTRPWDEFVEILNAWKIQVLVDVRTVPKSRAFPWFANEHMTVVLPRGHSLHSPAGARWSAACQSRIAERRLAKRKLSGIRGLHGAEGVSRRIGRTESSAHRGENLRHVL